MQLGRRSEEEREARAATKAAEKEAKAREKLRRAFFGSPAGQARVAFEGGAKVFQYEADVSAMRAVVKPVLLGSSAIGKETLSRGPVATLNAVCDEGWEIVSGSFVFVETGQVSRNKALSSGQQVATSGKVRGYYLFKRNEANKKVGTDPWEVPDDADAVALAEQVDD